MSAAGSALGFPLCAKKKSTRQSAARKSRSGWGGAVRINARRIRGERVAADYAAVVLGAAAIHRRGNGTIPGLSGLGVLMHARIQNDLVRAHREKASYRVSQLVELMEGQISRDTVIRQADRMVVGGQAQLLVRGEKGRGLESEYVFALNHETSFTQISKNHQERKRQARRFSLKKNPQNASLLPPSESFPSEKPPAEATPEPSTLPPGTQSVAVGSEDLSEKEPKQVLAEAIAQAVPGFCPTKAKKALQKALLKPKDLELLSREIGSVLAEIKHEATNPIGLLLFRLTHEPGRVMASARKAQQRRMSVDVACSDLVEAPFELSLGAKTAFAAWKQAERSIPSPGAPGYLDATDFEAKARKHLVSELEEVIPSEVLGAKKDALSRDLEGKGLTSGSPVWKCAWHHHWSKTVLQLVGIEIGK
jgi:hypothetical protein